MKAGIQYFDWLDLAWIPACVGMTTYYESIIMVSNDLTKKPKTAKNTGRLLIFTGDGKGKTTAALGLAVRASGHGQKVFILQFLKSKRSDRRKARPSTSSGD